VIGFSRKLQLLWERKKATGGARRSHSHPAETPNLTEKVLKLNY
jgi:hypothetical protein